MPTAYDALFYRYQREGSLRSARVVLPLLLSAVGPRSLLDVGCGAGAWLSVAIGLGVSDATGVDGDYIDRSLLLVEPASFSPRDVSRPFDMHRRYELVQCLEVAEHVPPACSGALVDNLVRHGAMVLFSAAVPGQGGKDHINEQPCEYWRGLFAARGYRLFDFVRPQIIANAEVEPWYRYNLMLFVHDERIADLPEEVLRTRVADDAPVPDLSPAAYRLRKALLAMLPIAVVSRLAVWKHRQAVRALRERA